MSKSLHRTLRKVLVGGWCAISAFGSTASFAADADNGKTLAIRWCSSCHDVAHDQKLANDQAPPFASLAKKPGFNANQLAFFVLSPHPNMPSLSLSRPDAADIADYIATLK
jgi:mono/diheme cytochrome c family protein